MAFSVGLGAKSVADIDMGGQNPYFSTYSQCYHYSFCPRGGPNSTANFDGGPWPDLPPLDPPLYVSLHICKILNYIYVEQGSYFNVVMNNGTAQLSGK